MGWWHTDADLYHQWEEAEERAEKWERTAREERARHERAITELRITGGVQAGNGGNAKGAGRADRESDPGE